MTGIYIAIGLGFLAGVVVGIWRYRKNKGKKIISLFRFDEALQYAETMQKEHSNITATMISLIVNDKTGQKTIVQAMLDADGNVIKKGTDEILGRMVPVNNICSKLHELLENDCKCTIQLPTQIKDTEKAVNE